MLSEDIIRADGTIGPLGQRFEDAIPAQSESTPEVYNLGPFTIPGGGTSDVLLGESIDYGPEAHIITAHLTIEELDWAGNTPTQFAMQLYTSLDGVNFVIGQLSQVASYYGPSPSVVGGVSHQIYVVPQFVAYYGAWVDDVPGASVTVSLRIVQQV